MPKSNSPTFEYYAQANRKSADKDASETHKRACKYIEEKYPDAKPGSNYCMRIDKKTIPITDMAFLQLYTFRGWAPVDPLLKDLEEQAEAFVQQELLEQDAQTHSLAQPT